MSEHTYTVRWSDNFGLYVCKGLDARTAMARLRNALRERDRGSIVVHSVDREAQKP